MSIEYFRGWVMGTGVTAFSVALARQKWTLAASLFFLTAAAYVLAGLLRSQLPPKDK